MSNQPKAADPQEGTVQPATREQVKEGGVPDDSSSKAKPTQQRDERSGHDKDGNQEQGGSKTNGRQP